ncbi:hypothetical protein RRG08_047662 [Elysia crispata]|uniref:Uncharacterized protein n=1 Tax=Elysia crispata TaxID=231223 RepID=A0AAE1EFL9_9GAST|nr:hypothetical protein RRG08_047662 [Elysia crispata]
MLIRAEDGVNLLSMPSKTRGSPPGLLTSVAATTPPAGTVTKVTLLNDLVTFVTYGLPVTPTPAPVSPSQTKEHRIVTDKDLYFIYLSLVSLSSRSSPKEQENKPFYDQYESCRNIKLTSKEVDR